MLSNAHSLEAALILGWITFAVALSACGSVNGLAPRPTAWQEEEWSSSTSVSYRDIDNLLTEMVQDDGLPGVGVHVWNDVMEDGSVTLYGFVATATQKRKAEVQVREILRDFDLPINNRIQIRPELLASTSEYSIDSLATASW